MNFKTGLIIFCLLFLASCSGDLVKKIAVGELVEIKAESQSRCKGTTIKLINKGSSSSETYIYHATDDHNGAFQKFKPYLGKTVEVEAKEVSGILINCGAGVTSIKEIK